MKNHNSEFRTSSIDLCSFLLSKRLKIIKIVENEKRPGRYFFYFKKCQELAPLLSRFYNGTAQINLRKFLQSKSTIFEMLQQQTEQLKN